MLNSKVEGQPLPKEFSAKGEKQNNSEEMSVASPPHG